MCQIDKRLIVLAIFCQLDANVDISEKRGIPIDKLPLPDWSVGK